MFTNLTHANGTMTCTTSTGEVATRKTTAPYAAAILGRRKSDGKLVIAQAGLVERTVRTTFASIASAPVGSALFCKFSHFTDLQLVTPDAGWEPCDTDPTGAIKDAALLGK